MNSWHQVVERFLVQPERLVWLWLVGCAVLAVIIGELARVRWRRRLYALAHNRPVIAAHEPRRWVRPGVRILALVLIVLALADPRAGLSAIEVKTSRLQIVCLLDRSRSMMARDATPSRLEAGKNVVRAAVDRAGGGAVALATFSAQSRVDVPLTRDYQGLLARLDAVGPDDSQTGGTHIGLGLTTAATCFAERIDSPKILIVISDGEIHGVQPELPERMLPEETQVLVIGVGNAEQGAPLPIDKDTEFESDNGEYLTYEGKVVRSKANPEFLDQLATRLGGRFLSIHGGSATAAIAEAIRHAESSAAHDMRRAYRRQAAPRFHWLLLGALGLLCLEMMLPLKRRTGLGQRQTARFGSRRYLMLAILLPAMMASTGLAGAIPVAPPASQSETDSRAPKASQLTERQLRKAYNQGVHAYRDGRWNDAELLFRTVIRHGEDSLQAKARFNLANTLYAIVNRGGISQQDAIEQLQTAIGLLRQNIAEGRRTEDARANIEIIYRRLLQIQQQQPEANGDGKSPPTDQPPDGDTPPQEENGSQQDEQGDDDEQPQQDGSDADDRQGPGDGSGRGDRDQPPPGGGGDRPGTSSEPGDSPNGPQVPDAGGGSDSRRPDAVGPINDPTAPLSDEQAEDQLRRVRQRATDGRDDEDQQAPAPISDPPGLPW